MIVYGHRGASAELPENTLPAFARALERGVGAIETDVHITRDGHVVIHHDDSTLRMAGLDRAVASLTLAELSAIDVGLCYRGDNWAEVDSLRPFRAPTLAEALEAFPKVRFNIDIKPGSAAVPAVIDVVRAHGAEGRVLLTSFYDDATAAIRAAKYLGDTGLAQREALAALALPRVTPGFLWPRGDRAQLPHEAGGLSLLRRGLIDKLHRRAFQVDFWVINEPAIALRARDAGADGVMTDDPKRIVPALG